MAVKRYCFHFWCTTGSSLEVIPPAAPGTLPAHAASNGKSSTTYTSRKLQPEVAHYGSSPYEALYEGYFLDPAAAKQYLQLFHQEHDNPYTAQALAGNIDQLACLVSCISCRLLVLVVAVRYSTCLQQYSSSSHNNALHNFETRIHRSTGGGTCSNDYLFS
jgi:hypothetical protein